MEKMEYNIPDRVTRLEQQVEGMQRDIAEIKVEVKQSATKSDLVDLKAFFEERDRQYKDWEAKQIDNIWKVVYGLIILLGGLVVTTFAVKELPKIFM